MAGVGGLLLVGCAHGDASVPVAGTATMQSPGPVAAGQDAGVRVVAKARSWSGDPPTLAQYVLPIWIEVENHSGRALSLSYGALRIEEADGSQRALTAIPPLKVKGNAIIPVWAVPPEFRPADPWLGTWLEPDFDSYLAQVSWKESLPTREMRRRAIREGVVADGRKIKGFVYFQKMQGNVAAVTLRTDLVDAMTQQSFGRIEIPLAIGND